MLQEVRVDDYDGVSLGANTHTITVDGVTWEIDLTEQNFAEFYRQARPWLDKGHVVSSPTEAAHTHGSDIAKTAETVQPKERKKVAAKTKTQRRATKRVAAKSNGHTPTQEIRIWAAKHGHHVAPTGRVPRHVVAEYEKATKKK